MGRRIVEGDVIVMVSENIWKALRERDRRLVDVIDSGALPRRNFCELEGGGRGDTAGRTPVEGALPADGPATSISTGPDGVGIILGESWGYSLMRQNPSARVSRRG